MQISRCIGTVLAVLFCQHIIQNPLLAGETAGTSPPIQTTQVTAVTEHEKLLAEVFVNGRSSGSFVCYLENGEYWLPFSLFIEKSGLKMQEGNMTIPYQTTLGTIMFNPGSLKTIDRTLCISLGELKKTFLVGCRFDQSNFAFVLDIPWQAGSAEIKKTARPAVKPDITAPSSSLSFLRIEPTATWDFENKPEKNLFVEAGGRVANGVWDITFEGDPEKTMTPSRYHWTTYNRHMALRLGTGSSDIQSLVDNTPFTGVQFGWNNHNILNQLDFEHYSDSDIFLTLDRTQQRTIEGKGPPAAIAELRLDGVVVARQRIGLDGRFVFSNVRMTTDLRKTEVYLYERSLREKPLAVLNYTISILNRSMPAHEILIRGGTGILGNPLDNAGIKRPQTGFAHIQYGLSNRITLEAAYQYNPDTASNDFMAGTAMSIGKNWAASFYGTDADGHLGADARVEGHGKNWDLSALSSWREAGFSGESSEREQNQSLRFSTSLLSPFDLLLYGTIEKKGDVTGKKFLLPGAYLSVFPWLTLSAIPNDDERYRYEADLKLGSSTDMSIVYEKRVVTADLRTDISESLISRLLNTYAIDTHSNLTSLYLDWYPTASHFDVIRIGASRSDGQYGFSGAWSKFMNAGLRFTLQYSYNMNNAQQIESQENFSENGIVQNARQYVGFTMTWDMGFSKKKSYPINRTAISSTRGGLAGSLDIMNDTNLGSSDINDVDILVNGRKLSQRQIDGTFFVGNLPPGIYTVDIDTEKLPLELNVTQNSVKAEVRNGAVTEVNIPVYAEYGVAGCLTDPGGNPLPGRNLEITANDGKPSGQVTTDQFGYYRLDGLRPGMYAIRPAGSDKSPEKTFVIKNDYVFDLNLTVPSVTAISP
ncbi:MAG: carboxypeptidase regulatory-like domain-containing protein [Chlorobiaceae bacterium]|nr:carboxypeptidase regulatory-like domain-containing protein [Chlorobiaceae bacterium]